MNDSREQLLSKPQQYLTATGKASHRSVPDKVKNIDTDQATSSAELSDTDSQIDTAILETMPGGAAKRPRILNMFLTSMQKQLTAMHDGLAMADAISIMESAHTLKSSSATVGATGLTELCKTLEHATRQGEATDANALVAEIDRISQLVEQEIRSAYL